MKPYFFRNTHSAHIQITELFDFVWPGIVAMFNLRTQVESYLQANPDATDLELDKQFAQPASVFGASLKTSWHGQSWESQQENFARMLLINIVAIYEGWIRGVLKDLQLNDPYLAKSFEFAESGNIGMCGIGSALALTTADESLLLKQCFYDRLCANKMYSLPHLDAMMACYRYFKELRNCELHNCGLANNRLLEAYNDFAKVATVEQLGCYVVPRSHAPVLGQKTRIEMHGVAGLTSIVLRAIVTLDAELSRSHRAEMAFVRKWRNTHHRTVKLSGDQRQVRKTLLRMFWEAGFPLCDSVQQMQALLQQFALVYLPIKRDAGHQVRRQFNGARPRQHSGFVNSVMLSAAADQPIVS